MYEWDEYGLFLILYQPQIPSIQEEPKSCFILASSNNPLMGKILDVKLVEIAPTVPELGGYDIPAIVQGKSLVSGMLFDSSPNDRLTSEEDEIQRVRLSGLGYLE